LGLNEGALRKNG